MDDLGSQRRERDCLLIGLGEVGTVHSLPAQLRAKWAAAAEYQLPDRSLGGLQARLDAADANRQVRQGCALSCFSVCRGQKQPTGQTCS